VWIHTLALDSSRTNRALSFMGFGALGASAALVVRILRTAMRLRQKCEELSLGIEKPPADPTRGLLGDNWWQVPSLFAAAWVLAWALLDLVGAGRLFLGGA
jgi:hypothetical protein